MLTATADSKQERVVTAVQTSKTRCTFTARKPDNTCKIEIKHASIQAVLNGVLRLLCTESDFNFAGTVQITSQASTLSIRNLPLDKDEIDAQTHLKTKRVNIIFEGKVSLIKG